MTNVIKFPKVPKVPLPAAAAPAPVRPSTPATPSVRPAGVGQARRLLDGVCTALWVVAVLLWTPVKWVLSIFVFVQLGRLLLNWNLHNGLVFVASFIALCALTYFVSYFKPKGS